VWTLPNIGLAYKAFVKQILKLGRNRVCVHRPIHERISWEQKFLELQESSRERKFLGEKVLGTFAPGSESSRERKFQGANVPYHGTFAPGNESS